MLNKLVNGMILKITGQKILIWKDQGYLFKINYKIDLNADRV